jgi:dihydrolipoamide dehydrogenase
MKADVIVIGGGPAGYVAAIRASQLGAKVTFVGESKLGGTCLNRGCIPTKTMVKGARMLKSVKKMADFGINVSDLEVDFAKFASRKDKSVKKLLVGLRHVFKSNAIEIMQGRAVLVSAGNVEIQKLNGGGARLMGERIIIATGSRPMELGSLPTDGETIMESAQLLRMNSLPSSLVVVGGGIIGVEFATIFQALGSRVTVVEMLPHLLCCLERTRKLSQN